MRLKTFRKKIHKMNPSKKGLHRDLYYEFLREEYPLFFQRVWNVLDELSKKTNEDCDKVYLDLLKDETFEIFKL